MLNRVSPVFIVYCVNCESAGTPTGKDSVVAPRTCFSGPAASGPDCAIGKVVLLLTGDVLSLFGQRLTISPAETSKKNTPAAVSRTSRRLDGVIWARSSGDRCGLMYFISTILF